MTSQTKITTTDDLIHTAIWKLQLALGYSAKGEHEEADKLGMEAKALYKRWCSIQQHQGPG